MAVRSLNKVMLIAYVGDEPTIRNNGNSKVANFSMVTNDSRPNEQGGYEEIPQWHRIVAWNRNADIVERYIHKGSRLYVEGRIKYGSYTDKNDIKRYTTEIVAENILMLDSRRDNAAGDFNSGNSSNNANSWDNSQNTWGGSNRNDANGWGSSAPSSNFYNKQPQNNFNGGYQSSNFGNYQGGAKMQEPQSPVFNGGVNNIPNFNNAAKPQSPVFNGGVDANTPSFNGGVDANNPSFNNMHQMSNQGMQNMQGMNGPSAAPQNVQTINPAPSSSTDDDDVPF